MSADKCEGTPVTWAELIEGTRAERLRSFCADPTGHVLKEMQTNGNFSSTGALIQDLNEQNAKLRADLEQSRAAFEEVNAQLLRSNAELTAVKQEVENWRQLDAMQQQTTANQAKLDASRKAEKESRQEFDAELDDLMNQSKFELMQRLAAAHGMCGSFARQIAKTAISVGPVDVEDHRVANAERAERKRIIQKLEDARNALLEYSRSKQSLWRRLFGNESEDRADAAADALEEFRKSIQNPTHGFQLLEVVRPIR